MKRRWRLAIAAAAAGALLGLGGLLVAASGLIPIGASGGHWAITEWFLDFSKRRSIATHTIGLDLPALDQPWQILKGAGHYETACRPCHGAPGLPRPRIAEAMLPKPAVLSSAADTYDADELFYVVKHGIKLTGMPAWTSRGRDDEIQAVTAFLLALPSLDAAAYRRLVFGDEAAGSTAFGVIAPASPIERLAAEECARCHGHDGRGRGNAAFPALAGQKRAYLERALAAYAAEQRHSGIMGPIAAELGAEQQRELAAYYSALPARRGEPAADDARIARGRAIAMSGIAAQDVPPCQECHDPQGRRSNEAYPVLAGQYAEYLELQLALFAAGERGGSAYAHLMDRTAKRLTAEQRRDVAAYFAREVLRSADARP